jgi:RimJ/RimL family protein N-acetyltransferase
VCLLAGYAVSQAPVVSPATTHLPGPVPALHDDVISLRELRTDDVEAIIEHAGQPGMSRWASVPQPFTRADAEAYIATAVKGRLARSSFYFVIESRGRFAGLIDLRGQGAGLAEVGFSLMAWARGRGWVVRALRLVIGWAFSSSGPGGRAQIEVVQWRAEVGNWPSRRAAWAVGFQIDEAIPGLVENNGRRVDGWIAGLRRGDLLQPAHPWLRPERIIGQGVSLRGHRPSDLARMVEAYRDPLSQRWLFRLPPDYTIKDAEEKLFRISTEQASGRAVYWAVTDPLDDRILAEVALGIRDRVERQGEIGYWAHPDARGRGVITEAVRLVVRHALLPAEDGGLGLARILLRTEEGNLASQRVAEKTGFSWAGIDRWASRLPDGTMVNDIRFDLLADELPAVR